MKAAVIGLLVCFAGTIVAQQPKKTPVYFGCTCADPVGALYATAFRDLLASSPRYIEASEAQPVNGRDRTGSPIYTYNWHVSVVSEDPSIGDTGNSAALSIVILVGDSYFNTQYVQSCPRAKVAQCAADTFSELDAAIHQK